MNSRQRLPEGLRRRYWRRRRRLPSGAPSRYLHARRRGLRRFAGVLVALAVALCVLAVFA